MSAEVARQQLEYQKERDAKWDPTYQKVVDTAIGINEDNRARAADQWDYYEQTGRPAEQRYYDQVATIGTPEEQEKAAGRATQDVNARHDVAAGEMRRSLGRFGSAYDPSSGRATGLALQSSLARAKDTAFAGTSAREGERKLGLAAAEGAAKFSRGLPSTGLAADAAALSGGQSATSAIGAQGALHNAGTSLGLNANAQAGNLYLGQFNAQNAAYQGALQSNRDEWSGLGTLAGMGLRAYGMSKGIVYKDGGEVRRPKLLKYARGGMTIDHETGQPVEGESGEVVGPGTGTSDSVPAVVDGQAPARLSDGEFVVRADTTQNVYGPETMHDVNEGKAEVIPSKVLAEIGRHTVRAMLLSMAKPLR